MKKTYTTSIDKKWPANILCYIVGDFRRTEGEQASSAFSPSINSYGCDLNLLRLGFLNLRQDQPEYTLLHFGADFGLINHVG